MMLLHWFFRLLSGEPKINWLSIQFSRWKSQVQNQKNHNWERAASQYELFFEVQGAGKIAISKDANHMTGTAYGFGFGVSWGSHGYCGGVIGREEARRLANYILKEAAIRDAVCSEQQAVKNFFERTKQPDQTEQPSQPDAPTG